MENPLQILEHEKFGKVRVVMINGEPWFVAADVCRVLDLKNPSDILKRLDVDEKGKIPEDRVVVDPILNIGSKNREVNIVNEFGLYRLIMSSRKKEAHDFQRWVYHEVLPAIRKHGYYVLPTAETPPVPVKKKRRPISSTARVYVFLMSDGTIKIGHSDNIHERIARIERTTKLTVTDFYYTVPLSRKAACEIEWCCQKKLSSRRADGEFFNGGFSDAREIIESFVSIDFECNIHVLKIAITMKELNENQVEAKALLLHVANFFVGKNFF